MPQDKEVHSYEYLDNGGLSGLNEVNFETGLSAEKHELFHLGHSALREQTVKSQMGYSMHDTTYHAK